MQPHEDCRDEAEYSFVKGKNAKNLQMGSMQHVSRSGEKGRTASLWLVGESRLLYVRTKGNIAEALSYNLLMYRGDIWEKREFICQSISMEKFGIQVLRFTNKGILSNLYGVCEYIDLVVKNRLKKLQDS